MTRIKLWILKALGLAHELDRLKVELEQLRLAMHHLHIAHDKLQRKYKVATELDNCKENK